MPDSCREQPSDLRFFGQVALHDERFSAAECSPQRFYLRAILPAMENKLRPLAGKLTGDSRADPSGRTSDENDFAVEFSVHFRQAATDRAARRRSRPAL